MKTAYTIFSTLLFTIVLSFQSHAQRYFEFHYPDNVTTCPNCEGLGEEENFIVKVEDDNTEFIERALSDLQKHDSLKQYFVRGIVQYAQNDFNHEWSWEFNCDTTLILLKLTFADSYGGVPSDLEQNLEYVLSVFNGRVKTELARVLREVFPTSINFISTKKSFNVFPNPMIDKVVIDFTDLSDIQFIEIRQMDGKLVKELRQIKTNKIELFRNDFNSAGTYIINATTIQGNFSKKLIITK